MKKLIAILLLFTCIQTYAQTTKIRGRAVDADTGEGIPFVGVFFKGTTTGITTDSDGYYILECRDLSADVVCAQLLGYDAQESKVKPGTFTNLDFKLKLTENRLTGSFVKADNRRVRRLLANIDRHRDRNNPEKRPGYICDLYNKMELDLSHAKEQITNKRVLREFGFIFNYMDTSVVSGVPYLPIMISESVAERRHSLDPNADDEQIIANRISGINPDNNLLTQFTGSLHFKINFYNPYTNAFGAQFPSPIQNSGLLFYNYYIIDSLQVDGRKTYLVRYHPKEGISSPAFDGEMQIDCEDFALRSVHAKMKRSGNVNWVRDIVIDAEYQRMEDGTWFYKNDKLYVDFSLALSDSSKMMSFLANREIAYSNPRFEKPLDVDAANGLVKVNSDSNFKDEAYWASVRPHELSRKEKDIYVMVDAIKDAPLYRDLYSVVYTAINGYWDIGNIGIGPYHKLFSFNNLEGFRPQLGIQTSKDFSQKHRFRAYVAYGTRDRGVKGGASYQRMFRRDLTRKLTLDAHYDVFQLGRGSSDFTDGNILASVMGKGNQRLAPMSSCSALYQHEFSQNFNSSVGVAMNRYFANAFVPMETPGGDPISSIATNEIHLMARFSKEETVNRGFFEKKYIHTKFPVLTLDLTGSVPGIRKGDCGFLRPEFSLDWRFPMPPAGFSKIHFNAGTIIGNVPYPLLHLHEGNGTYVLDKKAFSCMDYFEFASDTWATLFWNHCFNGFFFGKIPLLRKLQWREEFTFKMAYGTLSDRNNGDRTIASPQASMLFPEGMHAMGTPYIEAGAGISNILKIFRVDAIWRLTHRSETSHNFAMNFGLEFRF